MLAPSLRFPEIQAHPVLRNLIPRLFDNETAARTRRNRSSVIAPAANQSAGT